MAGTQRRTPFRLFRLAALAEAVSWTGLLIGMVFKYLIVRDDIGVRVFGPIHGALFLCYVASVLLAWRTAPAASRWSPLAVLAGLAASIPPFGTLFFERWAVRRSSAAKRAARTEARGTPTSAGMTN
jgi:integral membrane protein